LWLRDQPIVSSVVVACKRSPQSSSADYQTMFVCTGLISAAKLVPTFPAATAAAGSGYIAPSATAQALRDTTTTNFGLFSVGLLLL